MAILTEALQIQTSFPQIAQQYAVANERKRREDEREKEKAEAERKQVAKEQGVITAGIEGLQSYPALYGVAQELYNDYNKAEASGDVEQSEMIKNQLAKFIDGAAAFSRSEQNLFNAITTDPEQLKKYDNSVDDINGILQDRRNRQYSIKREGGSYTVVDGSGNSFGLFEMPELAGQSFVGELNQKSAIPSYVNAISFAESRANAILGRNDVVDPKTGKIINKDKIQELLSEDFRVKLVKNPEFMDGLIYDYQKAQGEMEKYDQAEIDRLKTDAEFVNKIRDQYIQTSVETVSQYAKPVIRQPKEDATRNKINEIPVVGGVADFSKYGESIRFFNEQGGLTSINQISVNPAGGLSTRQYIQKGTDPQGNPIMTEADVNITRGSNEWNRLAAYFGGEKYLLSLIKRMDPGSGM